MESPTPNLRTSKSPPRWTAYLMFCGLVCFLARIVLYPILQFEPIFSTIVVALGYFGLLLIFISFFIHISIEY